MIRMKQLLHTESSQCAFVEPRQDQLLFTRVGVDVADGEDARLAGLEIFGVDTDLALFNVQAPVGDGPEVGRQTPKDEDLFAGYLAQFPFAISHLEAGELIPLGQNATHHAVKLLQLLAIAQGLHLRYRGGLSPVFQPPVDQGDGFGLAVQFQCPVERGIAATQDDDVLAGNPVGVGDLVVNVFLFLFGRPRRAQAPGLEGAQAGRQDDRRRIEFGALGGDQLKAAVLLAAQLLHRLAKMEFGAKRLDLLQQPVDQFLGAHDGKRRNVIDWFLGVQLRALATRLL